MLGGPVECGLAVVGVGVADATCWDCWDCCTVPADVGVAAGVPPPPTPPVPIPPAAGCCCCGCCCCCCCCWGVCCGVGGFWPSGESPAVSGNEQRERLAGNINEHGGMSETVCTHVSAGLSKWFSGNGSYWEWMVSDDAIWRGGLKSMANVFNYFGVLSFGAISACNRLEVFCRLLLRMWWRDRLEISSNKSEVFRVETGISDVYHIDVCLRLMDVYFMFKLVQWKGKDNIEVI